MSCFYLYSFFPDPGFLSAKVPEVINTSPSYDTFFVDVNFIDKWGRQRENSFDANISGDLSHCKGLIDTFTCSLQHHSLEVLDPFLVTFFNLIMDRDGITGLEYREFPLGNKTVFDELYGLRAIHNIQIIKGVFTKKECKDINLIDTEEGFEYFFNPQVVPGGVALSS